MTRVLLVDDDEDFLMLAKEFLEEEEPSFELITTRSARIALQTLEQVSVDAVVVDYSMPEMDGLEFLQNLRLEGNWIPFIMFTGKGHEDVAMRALNLGADYYLTKEGDHEQLYGELANIIQEILNLKEHEKKENLQKEEALRVSEERFRELADLLPQTIFEIDLEGNFTFANRYGLESTGYTQEDLETGVTAFHLFVPEERARVKRDIQRVLAGQGSEGHEYLALRKDGSKFPVLIHSSAIIRNNNPIGLRGIVVDITEQKKAEEAIRESEKKYRSLVETSPDAIALTDLNGTIIMANQQGVQLAGFQNTEEMIGLNAFAFFAERDQKAAVDNMRKVLSFGSIKDIPFTFIRPNGAKIPAELSASLILDDDGLPKHFMVVIRDITERKQAEETFRDQRAELSEFAHAMADDLRKNLHRIESYMDLLASDLRSDKSHVEKVNQLTRNMNQLLHHLVVLADAGLLVDKAKVIDLGSLVKKVAEATIPDNIVFMSKDLPMIMGDREKIAQVFRYLFENAVRHGKPAKITVFGKESEDGKIILISNDGIPISPESRQDIFQRGYSTKKDHLGLGLAIAQKLIEAHGWKINLEKSPETTFRIKIPTE
ncbi:MAG: PAS domain S-box protein [Candidatus Hodarchaeota archaeon]